MIRRSIAFCILIFMVVGAAHAATNDTPSETMRIVTITDDFGDTITIEGTPQRIISLAPSNTEILFALGIGDRVVGVTDYCNYPPEVEMIDRVGGYSTVNIEKVISLEPDLILGYFGNTEDVINHLKDLGFNVVAFHPATISDVLDDILIIGTATGAESQAQILVEDSRQRIETVITKTSTSTSRPSVVHVVWNDPIYVSGNATFQNEMIEIAGGVNAYPEITGWEVVSLESFIERNPDIIIANSGSGMGGGSEDMIADYFRKEPRFQEVNAVKNNHIYVIDADTVDRAGPRIINALELFSSFIHPELVAEETSATVPPQTTPASASPYLVLLTMGAILIALCAFCTRRGR
jgi:iron complex transport system substrate-binding protein